MTQRHSGPRWPVPGEARILLGRSVGRTAFVLLMGACALHILGRPMTWRNEWMWAFYQYAFVTVLLGPLGAGVAAWDGARWARSRESVAGSPRATRALSALWGASVAWVLAAFVLGQLVVVALVLSAGTPGRPGWRELLVAGGAALSLLPPLAFGFAAGWFTRSRLAAPVSAVGCFLLTLYLFIAGPRQFVEVGGAGDTLVGLTPKVASALLRGAVAVAVSVLVLVVIGFVVRGRWWREALPAVVAATGLGLVSAVLVIQPSEALRSISRELRCFGAAPTVCAAPSYERRLPQAREALLPYLRTLDEADIPAPTRFVQGVVPSARQGGLSLRLLRGDDTAAGPLVLATFLTKDCATDLAAFEALSDDFTAFSWWVVTTTDPASRPGDTPATLPSVLVDGTPEEQQVWARSAAQRLHACVAT